MFFLCTTKNSNANYSICTIHIIKTLKLCKSPIPHTHKRISMGFYLCRQENSSHQSLNSYVSKCCYTHVAKGLGIERKQMCFSQWRFFYHLANQLQFLIYIFSSRMVRFVIILAFSHTYIWESILNKFILKLPLKSSFQGRRMLYSFLFCISYEVRCFRTLWNSSVC